MENNSRRNFLKSVATIGTAAAVASVPQAKASQEKVLSANRMGVLVDTTVCIGCRHCEWACKDAHGLDAGDLQSYHNRDVFDEYRRPTVDSLTVVNEFPNPKNALIPINVKENCRHCNYPSCMSACIVGAFTKLENGAVVWDGNKCIGCRYCMMACPFQIPTFEFEKAIEPEIRKCDFCYERQAKGEIPACVDICPVESMIFAPINEVISLAQRRIKRYPERYEEHIYGLEEVGGTSWIYLTAIDSRKLNFVELNKKPVPGTVESIQHGIFAYFVPPIALYAWLGGIMWISKRKKDKQNTEETITKEEN